MTAEQIIIWSFVAVVALILVFKVLWDLSSKSTYDKISTKRGVDIYIDNENKVAYISLNNNTSEEAIAKIKEGLKNSETYEIIVMENINNINFLK